MRRHHDAEIDDLVIVTLEHDADDVLADVVDVAFHRREEDAARGRLIGEAELLLLPLHEGHEIGDGALHDAGRLHDLRQEHLAGAEQVADDVHASHQGTFDDVQRARCLGPRLLGVLLDIVGDAVDQRVSQALLDRLLAPGKVGLLLLPAAALVAFGRLEQAVGRVCAPIEDHVLDQVAQLGLDIVIKRKLPGIDDAHVHARLDRVVQEHRVHRFTHALVAAEGERQVRHAAGHMHVRQLRLDAAGRLDEGAGVVVVLLDAGGDGEDIRVEDDVLGWKVHLLGEKLVGALADRELALGRLGLTRLVERHDDNGGAVAQHLASVLQERPLAFLHADGVHHRLALHAFQARLDDRPFRRVDHDRHARDVRLGGDEVEEGRHGLLGIEHALVHVDVEHVGAVLDLLARDLERRGVIIGLDQLAEARGPGDVGPLAHHDEILRCVGHL